MMTWNHRRSQVTACHQPQQRQRARARCLSRHGVIESVDLPDQPRAGRRGSFPGPRAPRRDQTSGCDRGTSGDANGARWRRACEGDQASVSRGCGSSGADGSLPAVAGVAVSAAVSAVVPQCGAATPPFTLPAGSTPPAPVHPHRLSCSQAGGEGVAGGSRRTASPIDSAGGRSTHALESVGFRHARRRDRSRQRSGAHRG